MNFLQTVLLALLARATVNKLLTIWVRDWRW